jgi:hypothetical protein
VDQGLNDDGLNLESETGESGRQSHHLHSSEASRNNENVQQKTNHINVLRKLLLRVHPTTAQTQPLSLSEFQQVIRNFIWSIPVQREAHRQNIEAAMARAWDLSQKTFRPLCT